MSKSKVGVLIINLGTPDSYSVPDVKKYLKEFLMDGRVIDIPFWRRWPLINFVIAPFRAPQSAKGYHQLWLKEGASPLKIYGEQCQALLQYTLGDEYQVEFAMRYQSPSIASILWKFKDRGISELIVIPLYPQYASASTGSIIEKVLNQIKNWEVIPTVKVISQFFNHPLFIKAFTELGKTYMEKAKFDHYLFSYHGLPEGQILKASCDNYCKLGQCCNAYHAKNRYCYRAQCYETTHLLVKELGIKEGEYTVSFQSRLGKAPWIKPYTDEVITFLADRKIKSVLVFAPSFVADCLETTIEIDVEYRHLFEKRGGERLQMVESLNVHPSWIECLKQIVLENTSKV